MSEPPDMPRTPIFDAMIRELMDQQQQPSTSDSVTTRDDVSREESDGQ
jgi:hypothetical protein